MITITAEAAKTIERQAFKIRRGWAVFVKSGDTWLIAGPTQQLTAGATVEVAKASGAISTVVVTEATDSVPVSIRCSVAAFTSAAKPAPAPRVTTPTPAPAAPRPSTYRTCPDCGQRWTADHEEFCVNFSGGY